jgi:hypothetical protein
MVKYKCNICGKEFNQKCHFLNHTEKRKKSCLTEKLDTDIPFQNVPKCSKTFQNVPSTSENIEKNIGIEIKSDDVEILNSYYDKKEYVNTTDDNNNNFLDENVKCQMNSIETEIICKYCFRIFSRMPNLNKHLKNNCKVKKQQEDEKEDIFKRLLLQENMLKQKDEQINKLISQNGVLINKINVLEEKVDKISKNNNSGKQIVLSKQENNDTKGSSMLNTTNISNSNISTSNTTNTNNGVIFNLVNYGKEDLNKIDTKHFINNIVKNNKASGVKIPEEILKLIHFNPDYPELNNIYISDINREKCMVWDDGMWKLTTDDKIPEVIDKVVKYSYDKQDELREKYSNNKPFIERLNVINKYTKLNDVQYVDLLKEDQELNDVDNNDEIKRCDDFQKKTYETFKTTMYNEGLKIKKNKKLLN